MPLLGTSLLTPSSIPGVSKLLSELITLLRDIQTAGNGLTPSLISYVFFPVSAILRRNASSAIPDQVMEKMLIILGILCEDWWWSCEIAAWEQIFMLCGAIVGGIEGKGKGKQRDDETKEAAVRCMFALLRVRNDDEGASRSVPPLSRLQEFQQHAQTTNFVPILGQTLNALLILTDSRRIALQRVSLDVLHLLIDTYAPDYLLPSVLPGVVSTTTKLALGSTGGKGWANGDIVAGALKVMQVTILRSIGDDVCSRDGAVRPVVDLEDLATFVDDHPPDPQSAIEERPYATSRTPSWLRGTSSQLHIALNSLTSLVKHPTPLALLALSTFSSSVLSGTASTLPQSQALLLSFLLSLSMSDYESVSSGARGSLLTLLTTPSNLQHSLLQTLMHQTRDSLAALPRLIPSQSDAKVEHLAGLIEAVCRLAAREKNADRNGLSAISLEIGKLLGPTGGIEKWGWNLLSVLEFADPPVTVTRTSVAQLMLESDPSVNQWVVFPEVILKNVSTRSSYEALMRMLQSLGWAAGDSCLSAVEWFTNVGQSGTSTRAVAATWCACRLLEGVAGISLLSDAGVNDVNYTRSRRLEKFSRGLAKSTSQLWDETSDIGTVPMTPQTEEDSSEVLHVKGLDSLSETLKILHPSSVKQQKTSSQPMLHRALSLQLLAVTSGILQAQFTPLLINTLYPVLHSLVSSVTFLSSTALATLNFITTSTSYASPGNLLMSNFDYALDAVSRRLTRRWLDVDATKVLVIMVHIIGNDVVERAGDVVEECFDRLDEFHGYEVIVEGLVDVLNEVIKVIKIEEDSGRVDVEQSAAQSSQHRIDSGRIEDFFEWLSKKTDSPEVEENVDYGPAPREAWGQDKGKEADGDGNADSKTVQDPITDETSPTPTQALTKQIVARSMYFLTHGSAVVRARILTLLSSSVSVLHESALLPSIHSVWPFILNRLADPEFFVVCAAASLVEALATHMGSFMFQRIWDDIWPRFHKMLAKLDIGDTSNALSKRGRGAVGTESAYTYSHRLYRSLLKTMAAAMQGVPPQDSSVWEVIISFRRFLHSDAHEELQYHARELYVAIGRNNGDAVWLALHSTLTEASPVVKFLRESKWDIEGNAKAVFERLDS